MNQTQKQVTHFSVEFQATTGKRYDVSSNVSEVRTLGLGSRTTTVYGLEASESLRAQYDTIYTQVVEDFQNQDTYKTFILHGIGAYDGTAYVQFCIARTIEKMMK
jgi:hypothetical protein